MVRWLLFPEPTEEVHSQNWVSSVWICFKFFGFSKITIIHNKSIDIIV